MSKPQPEEKLYGMDRARLLVVDHYDLMRIGLKIVLGRDTSLGVVGEAKDSQEAIVRCRELQPDLVLMDVSMPELDGIEATRTIIAEFPKTSVLILTAHADHRLFMEAVRAGAAGFILKGCHPEHVLDAVRRILGGGTPLDQELAMQLIRKLVGGQRQQGAQTSGVSPEGLRQAALLPQPLTARELEVLRLMAQGRTNRKIAKELLISMGSVKAYVQRIIAKLEVSDRTQAAVKATELGILSAER
jgi:DNA-binding NarL/FixJ family response regulator